MTLIRSLFLSSGPPTILGMIGTIVVVAFNSQMPRWSFPHIREKILKRVKPSFADHNSASAVALIVFVFWVVAPRFHPAPDDVFWASRSTVGQSCPFLHTSNHALQNFRMVPIFIAPRFLSPLSLKAPATLVCARDEPVVSNFPNIATRTPTLAVVPSSFHKISEDRISSENLAGEGSLHWKTQDDKYNSSNT